MDERAKQSLDAIRRLLDRTTPWRPRSGWVRRAGRGQFRPHFGVPDSGPVDSAVRISVACLRALPGRWRVVLRDKIVDFGVDDLALKAFKRQLPEIDAQTLRLQNGRRS